MQEASLNDIMKYEKFFTIPNRRIAREEYIRTAKLGGLFLLLLLAVILFILPTYELSLWVILICMIVAFEVLSIPIEFLRVLYNTRRCPFEITLSNAGIAYDESLIATADIKSIILTDKNAVSSSIYPKYRYLRIKTANKKYTLWLGTESGFSYKEYEEFANSITEFCTLHSIPVYYKK